MTFTTGRNTSNWKLLEIWASIWMQMESMSISLQSTHSDLCYFMRKSPLPPSSGVTALITLVCYLLSSIFPLLSYLIYLLSSGEIACHY
jgi:hypothetical protein